MQIVMIQDKIVPAGEVEPVLVFGQEQVLSLLSFDFLQHFFGKFAGLGVDGPQ